MCGVAPGALRRLGLVDKPRPDALAHPAVLGRDSAELAWQAKAASDSNIATLGVIVAEFRQQPLQQPLKLIIIDPALGEIGASSWAR